MTQLRLAARDIAYDTFAWREGDELLVERRALEALAIVVPESVVGDRVPLASVPGLTYTEDPARAAIVLTCATACLTPQHIAGRREPAPVAETRTWGGYVNYDLAADWRGGDASSFGGVAEVNAFGPFGRLESSWFSLGGDVTRLETRWTMDMPARQVRLRVGDSLHPSVGGGAARFAGVQIGRHFGLAPSFVPYATPTIAGEAETRSTVALYIDGVLQARDEVEAGPFTVDTPLISGSGTAELVVTDVLGRERVLSRPFFVSTMLLQPGVTDWNVAFGAVRENYGESDAEYGETFAAARYRRGITQFLTAEAAFDATRDAAAGELALAVADRRFGQVRLAHARSENGGASQAAWFTEGEGWSAGVSFEDADAGFASLGRASGASRSSAATLNLELGDYGSVGFTAAVTSADDETARVASLNYTPNFSDLSAVQFRLEYAERERSELSVSVAFSIALGNDVSSSYAIESDRRGLSYRAGMQRPIPTEGGLGWRARTTGGGSARAEFSGNYRGERAEGGVQLAHAGGDVAARGELAGSVGVIERETFVARPIHSAFALVDVGAPDVGVSRDRLGVAQSGARGRALVTDLRANDENVIGIDARNLPFDRAPSRVDARVTPAEGAGVIVRFTDVTETLVETRARFASGLSAMRGSVLVRARDGERFPIGGEGRIVLRGARAGDVLRLDGDGLCAATIGDDSGRGELTLICAVDA